MNSMQLNRKYFGVIGMIWYAILVVLIYPYKFQEFSMTEIEALFGQNSPKVTKMGYVRKGSSKNFFLGIFPK